MSTLSSMRVLLVEDNAADADLIVEYLSRTKQIGQLEITRVTSMMVATKTVRDGDIDVVLLDLSLPDSQGLATVQELHEVVPETPIVVLTGSGADMAGGAIEAGAQDYLPKRALGTEVLVRTLTHAVDRARLQTQMRTIVGRMADGIVVVDRTRKVLFANPAAASIFSNNSLEGSDFEHPFDSNGNTEIEIKTPIRERSAEIRASHIKWYGTAAVLLSIRDITDRKRAEDLQRRLLHADRLASIGQLAAGVAHEINNPAQYVTVNLTCLQGEFQRLGKVLKRMSGGTLLQNGQEIPVNKLLAEAKLDSTMRDIHEMLDDNAMGMDRIVSIVKDLRTFARIERETVELLDVNEVLEVACNMTSNEVRHRAKLIKDFGRLPYIPADRGKLAQVFTNLLLNAAQAIQAGSADANRIRISTEANTEHVVITISDTGAGIPEATLPRIFEPFFTTKPREVGTGLGLALSAEIVRKHGGDISVVSREAEGTTFSITLPRDSALIVPSSRKANSMAASQRVQRGRVLVVDDEQPLLQAYERMLRRDHDVVTARGGRAAVDIIAKDTGFDVIVCDLMMPDIDGVAVYEEIKRRAPHLTSRIVYCTGGAFTQRAKNFTERVRNICLDKPVSWDLLRRVVNDICSRHSDRPSSSGIMSAADI